MFCDRCNMHIHSDIFFVVNYPCFYVVFGCRLRTLNGELELKNTPADMECIQKLSETILKKNFFFGTFFGNFDFEISRFCHSDTLKNEIPWTLTNDKKFFQVARFQKKFFEILQTQTYQSHQLSRSYDFQKISDVVFSKHFPRDLGTFWALTICGVFHLEIVKSKKNLRVGL